MISQFAVCLKKRPNQTTLFTKHPKNHAFKKQTDTASSLMKLAKAGCVQNVRSTEMPMSSSSNAYSSREQPWIGDPRWINDTLHPKHGSYRLHLKTMPGVIGGSFAGHIDGLLPEFYGRTNLTLTSMIVVSGRDHERRPSASAVTDYLEVKSIEVNGPRFEFAFPIPFEATCVSDGAIWTLDIEFCSGAVEYFEVPVYRTYESDPALTNVKIAAIASAQIDEGEPTNKANRLAPYELSIDEKLKLEIPISVRSQPSLFAGLAIFAGIWSAAFIGAIFFTGLNNAPWPFAMPLPVMAVGLLFLKFGVTSIEMDENQLTIRHGLFGVRLPSKVNRKDVMGFTTKCLGSLPSESGVQPAYMVGIACKGKGFKILTPALLHRWHSLILVKRLTQFWGIIP